MLIYSTQITAKVFGQYELSDECLNTFDDKTSKPKVFICK